MAIPVPKPVDSRDTVLRAPRILHLSADYPDAFESAKTPAVKNLVMAASGFEHCVVSLNRTAGKHREAVDVDEGLITLRYWGMPYGVRLHGFMERVADRIHRLVRDTPGGFDLIHAHKFSFEGICAHALASRLNIPYAFTIRGNTDTKVLSAKPGYRSMYRDIARSAAFVFYNAPWALDSVTSLLGTPIDAPIELPNIVSVAADCAPPRESKRFVCVCHLDGFRGKNLERVVRAIGALRLSGHAVELDIIGGGSQQSLRALERIVARRGEGGVNLLGPRPHDEVLRILPDYIAMAMPSHPETFGLVFIEALAAGIPALHACNAGIDGYFVDGTVVRIVRHDQQAPITQAMHDLYVNQLAYKQRVRTLVQTGGLSRFSESTVVDTYAKSLRRITSTHAAP